MCRCDIDVYCICEEMARIDLGAATSVLATFLGSDPAALQTTAERVMDGDHGDTIVGYKIIGSKQWISNGGVADAYTILANTPAGPSWFILEKGAKGFSHDEPEDKHGIRLSNTAALSLSDVYVDADRLVGGVEG